MFQVSKLSVKMSFLDNGVMSLTFFQGFLHWPIFISLYLSIFGNTFWFQWGFIWPFLCFKGCPGTRLSRINIFARPAGSSRSRWHNQSTGERYCQLLAQAEGQLFSHITGWIVWEGDPLSQDNFSPYNRGLRLLSRMSRFRDSAGTFRDASFLNDHSAITLLFLHWLSVLVALAGPSIWFALCRMTARVYIAIKKATHLKKVTHLLKATWLFYTLSEFDEIYFRPQLF